MAYHTYTTDALVIGSEDRLAADRMLMLFTCDAGLVYARAVSVRRERSKLRYGLQDFSSVRVSLVRGKRGWRIVGAEPKENLYFSASDRQVRAALMRTLKLMRRLVRGEEPHAGLYTTLADGLSLLASCRGDEIVRAERALTLRILAALGYVAPRGDYQYALSASSLGEALVSEEKETEEESMQSAIDEALAVSQL